MLGWLGPRALHALPDIEQALTDSDVGVRRSAAEAIGRILSTTPPP